MLVHPVLAGKPRAKPMHYKEKVNSVPKGADDLTDKFVRYLSNLSRFNVQSLSPVFPLVNVLGLNGVLKYSSFRIPLDCSRPTASGPFKG